MDRPRSPLLKQQQHLTRTCVHRATTLAELANHREPKSFLVEASGAGHIAYRTKRIQECHRYSDASLSPGCVPDRIRFNPAEFGSRKHNCGMTQESTAPAPIPWNPVSRRSSFAIAASRMKQEALSSSLAGYGRVAPTFDYPINGLTNRVTGVSPAVAALKQLIVSRLTVADGRNHSGGQSLSFETAPGGRASHPAASPQRRVRCDNPRFPRRTARKQFQNRFCHGRREIAIILSTPHLIQFRAVGPAAGYPQGILLRRVPAQPPLPRCLRVRTVHVIC